MPLSTGAKKTIGRSFATTKIPTTQRLDGASEGKKMNRMGIGRAGADLIRGAEVRLLGFQDLRRLRRTRAGKDGSCHFGLAMQMLWTICS